MRNAICATFSVIRNLFIYIWTEIPNEFRSACEYGVWACCLAVWGGGVIIIREICNPRHNQERRVFVRTLIGWVEVGSEQEWYKTLKDQRQQYEELPSNAFSLEISSGAFERRILHVRSQLTLRWWKSRKRIKDMIHFGCQFYGLSLTSTTTRFRHFIISLECVLDWVANSKCVLKLFKKVRSGHETFIAK